MSRGCSLRAVRWCAVMLAVLATPAIAPRAGAATPLLLPAAAGTLWQVAAGYNTVTHSPADGNDAYALDIVRADAPTEGTPVLAPIEGVVSFTSASCVSITDAQRTTVLLCHLFPVANLRGKAVARGALLGVVAPAGQANNNGLAHIHIALRSGTRAPLPFDGAYVFDGAALPATAATNAHGGATFASTNAAALSVEAATWRCAPVPR